MAFGIRRSVRDSGGHRKYTDAGMTEPEVGRLTFKNVVGHEPTRSGARPGHVEASSLPAADGCRVEELQGLAGCRRDARPPRRGWLFARNHDRRDGGGRSHQASAGEPEPLLLSRRLRIGLHRRTELTRKALERAGTLLGEPVDPKEVSSWGTRRTTSSPRMRRVPRCGGSDRPLHQGGTARCGRRLRTWLARGGHSVGPLDAGTAPRRRR